MRTANLNALQPLLLSLMLIAATPLAPLKAQENHSVDQYTTTDPRENLDREPEQNQDATPISNAKSKPKDARVVELENKATKLEQQLKAIEGQGFFGMAWPLWLMGGSSLIALLLALIALNRAKKQREAILELNRRSQNLLTRIGGVEVQIEQERVMNRSQPMAAPTPKPAPAQPQPSQTIAWPAAQLPDPKTDPVPCGPAPVSKASLINALNAADRQPLRESATAELNITSDSENALAMGRAISTELEVVPGGGSYWLISLQGQNWLFPTDRTLKGFAAAQPAKGLFHYEQQTIAQPQLIEPALLEQCGAGWGVKTMGRIATP